MKKYETLRLFLIHFVECLKDGSATQQDFDMAKDALNRFSP